MFLDCDWWHQLATRVKFRARGRCEKCGVMEDLQAHHLSYPAENFFDVTEGMLVCLCRKCHNGVHNHTLTSAEKWTPNGKRKGKLRKPKSRLWQYRLENVNSIREATKLRAKRLISREDYLKYKERFGADLRFIPKRSRGTGWYAGMYEHKVPGQVKSEVGSRFR